MFAAKCILNKEERSNKKHKFKKEEFASMYLILITEMGVSDEAKNVIPLKFLPKIIFFSSCKLNPGHTVYKNKIIILKNKIYFFCTTMK
jgi:hypothetical protein